MWWVNGGLWANGQEDGVGKTSSADGALSASKRNGPDLQTSIRARGMCFAALEAGHTSAPDHMLIADDRFRLHPRGRPHTSAERRGGLEDQAATA
jgi:hypothetical protein